MWVLFLRNNLRNGPVRRPVPVKRKEEGELLKVSALTKLIEEFQATEEVAGDGDRDGGGLPLTIYLPDCSSITVHVKETSNFKEVILQVLRTHEKQGVMPPLEYKDPGMYELRIHEGQLPQHFVVYKWIFLPHHTHESMCIVIRRW